MLFRDVISLISISTISDGAGGYSELEIKKQVFANKKSVRQSEFYQAMNYGLKPELVFEIRANEYNGEEKIEYSNKTYYVIRTYSRNDEMIELTVSSKKVN